MAQDEARQTIWEHLGELRSRVFKALLGLAAGVGISFIVSERFIHWLTIPIGGLKNLQSIEVTENIGVYMRVTLLSGFILAFPFIVYQLLAFVLPGLTERERKWLYLSIPLATILFLGGVAFTYFVMLPAAIPFLTGFLGVETRPRLSGYVNFTTNLMFWIGISFEMPLAVFILAKLRIVNAGILARQWRIAVVIIAIVAAVVSPTVDPINMALLMLPLIALYLLSILLAALAR